MTNLEWRPIQTLIDVVLTWNPLREIQAKTFQYIDLSAIDQDQKRIKSVREIACSEAPSRAKQIVKTNDILVSTVRPNLNGVAMVSAKLNLATASTGFCVLRPIESVLSSSYLFHWVKSPQFVADMVSKATGASYPAISDKIILTSYLPYTPLPEQRRIAAILDQADVLRAKRREALAQLDSLTQAIFVEMFGDPISNPFNWSKVTLGDLVLSASDGPHVSPNYSDTGVPFLSTRHVRPGEISWEDLKFISIEEATIQWKKCKPVRGDILYTKGGTTGFAAVVNTDESFAIWVHVALLKPNLKKVDSIWLESMLNSAYCYRQSQELTHGIANRDLGLKRMVKIGMYQPPIELQREFVHRALSVDKLKSTYLKSLKELDTLFASLQHQAFHGAL